MCGLLVAQQCAMALGLGSTGLEEKIKCRNVLGNELHRGCLGESYLMSKMWVMVRGIE